jgi:hypothetical protein
MISAAVAAGLVGTILTGGTARAELTNLTGAAYASLCQSRGVPLPPPWGSSKWKYNGRFAMSFNINDNWSYIYYWLDQSSTSPGMCVANPRPGIDFTMTPWGTENSTSVFGVICQGTNGKACFWDITADMPWNPSNGQTIYSPTPTGPIVPDSSGKTPLWVGGAALDGNGGACTDCHSGENVYINHPGTATDIVASLSTADRSKWFPTNWPDPIVRADDPAFSDGFYGFGRHWPENPGPLVPPSDLTSMPALQNCATCHQANGSAGRFPQIYAANSSNYCGTILESARDRNYDPNDPRGPQGEMPPFASTPGSFDPWWNYLLGQGDTPTGCAVPTPAIVSKSDVAMFGAVMAPATALN